MSTAARLAGFLLAVGAVFGIAVLGGRLVGPVAEEPVAHDDTHAGTPGGDGPGAGHQPAGAATGDVPGGLMVSQGGYALVLADDTAPAGEARRVRFAIEGPDGERVTRFDVEHEKRLHLIAVRRDFTGFQHVHPTMSRDGTWTTQVDLSPGTWRVYADFKPTGGDPLTLGADLAVAGDYRPAPATGEVRTATVGDYEVTLDGVLTPGADAELTLAVTKDGEPVTDLEPYLGAYGHLVALRGGDLAYLHVHPDGTPGDGTTEPGPEVVFYAAVPSPGTYHLYLDFQHQGVVRTAAFTVTAGTGGTKRPEGPDGGHVGGHDGGHDGELGDEHDDEHGH